MLLHYLSFWNNSLLKCIIKQLDNWLNMQLIKMENACIICCALICVLVDSWSVKFTVYIISTHHVCSKYVNVLLHFYEHWGLSADLS